MSNKDDLIYKIELSSEITQKTWHIYKKFTEFVDLNSILSQFFIRVPYFTKNSSDKSPSEIEIRKTVLEKYLKVKKVNNS